MHTITVNRFQLPVSAHHGDFLISPKGKSMHKHLIGILLILSTMAIAEEQKTMCANNAGTIIMGAVTNTPYCKSNLQWIGGMPFLGVMDKINAYFIIVIALVT